MSIPLTWCQSVVSSWLGLTESLRTLVLHACIQLLSTRDGIGLLYILAILFPFASQSTDVDAMTMHACSIGQKLRFWLYVFVDCAPPVCFWSTWSFFISLYLPVQCLLWYALMVHAYAEHVQASVIVFLSVCCSCPVLVLTSTFVILSFHARDAQHAPLPSVMCRIQSFC